jgi:glutamate--cysteine ligase
MDLIGIIQTTIFFLIVITIITIIIMKITTMTVIIIIMTSMLINCLPKWVAKDIPIMPKGRNNIMRDYMPKVGSLGLNTMFRTCTIQVILDCSLEVDMVHKLQSGLALQRMATSLFPNSSFTEEKPNGFLSYRSHICTNTDNCRCGMLPFVFNDTFGFESYVDYALDVPIYFVYWNNKYVYVLCILD